jgi:hypothetical protein
MSDSTVHEGGRSDARHERSLGVDIPAAEARARGDARRRTGRRAGAAYWYAYAAEVESWATQPEQRPAAPKNAIYTIRLTEPQLHALITATTYPLASAGDSDEMASLGFATAGEQRALYNADQKLRQVREQHRPDGA